MLQRLVLSLCLFSSLALHGCGGLEFMREPLEGEARLTSAPTGKALVNFHMPSGFGGSQAYEVFDRTELIGNVMGQTQFQYVCDPGQHVFMGVAQIASAIQAELAQDAVYDVVVNITPGWMTPNITLEPMVAGHPKRPELSAWEEREQLWIFVDDEASQRRSQARQEWATTTLEDFLNGSHRDRLQKLGPDDGR